MHSQNSVLVVAAYLIIAAAAIAGGRLACRPDQPHLASPTAEAANRSPPPAGRTDPPLGVSAHTLSRAKDQLAQLRQTLTATSRLLERRTALLHDKDAECRRLQGELDASIAFVFSLTAADQALGPPEIEETGRSELQEQLGLLRVELQRMSTEWQEQASQLEELRTALIDSETRIEELRLAAEDELVAMDEEREDLATALRETVAATGSEFVPALTELAKDRRPIVRAWAASALGRIGIDAAESAPTLLELLGDRDDRVRAAAQQALEAIAP